ncbi:unnamed protein product [Somion occarium]|uniref:DUF6533 domain-containing protein n=1 Tax=Somion occarium TaxID=3059160 RepID=A0ABP1E387_9APHY
MSLLLLDLATNSVCACITVMIWDILINLSEEIKYIWCARSTWTKWCYIYIRYSPIFAVGMTLVNITSPFTGLTLSATQCRALVLSCELALDTMIWVVDATLIARVYAIYNRSQVILRMLLFLLASEAVVMVVAQVIVVPKMAVSEICLTFNCLRNFQHSYTSHTLLYRIVVDGTWAFALIFAVLLLNTSMFALNITGVPPFVCFIAAYVVFSLAGSHLQLNIRRQANSTSGPTTGSVYTDMVFQRVVEDTSIRTAPNYTTSGRPDV